MISIILLALPLIWLLIGIVYFSFSLWKLYNKTVSFEIAQNTSSSQSVVEENRTENAYIVSTFTDDIRVVNSCEFDEEAILFLLREEILKQHSKHQKLDNLDIVLSETISNSIDMMFLHSKLLKNNTKKIRFDNVFQNKENIICQLQNLS